MRSCWTQSWWGVTVFVLSLCFLLGITVGGTTIEKRDGMPPGLAGPGIGMGPLGGYGSPPMGGGAPGGSYGGYDQPPAYGSPQPAYGAPQGASPPQYGQPPPYPPFGYKDPGFSVQTGFEGFLVPNSWYGLLPWGIEGVVIVIVGIIVAMVIVVSIVALLVWLTGFGEFALVKESARSLMPTSFIPSGLNMEMLNQLTTAVFDGLDRYNELIKAE